MKIQKIFWLTQLLYGRPCPSTSCEADHRPCLGSPSHLMMMTIMTMMTMMTMMTRIQNHHQGFKLEIMISTIILLVKKWWRLIMNEGTHFTRLENSIDLGSINYSSSFNLLITKKMELMMINRTRTLLSTSWWGWKWRQTSSVSSRSSSSTILLFEAASTITELRGSSQFVSSW